ncbi:LacI family transcriptional regulator [Cryobacterium suzukii]|uniref:LacI family transcriptional regulator n=1 Tax=Cryobacterium suzukii TaxID=1259198 RepID=A0A4R9AHY1_9MICO|nr:LacI family transcriptional regulator [Cryobacterium suzukii]
MAVNSHDVARIAGVSQSTVSRVLNGATNVRPETRDRVLIALENYAPNAHARAMRTNKTGTIGVVASDITNPYFPELLEAIYVAASASTLNIVLWNEHDPTTPAALAGIRSGMVDGVLFTSATLETTAIAQLAAQRVPTVLVNRGLVHPVCDQVTSNNLQIGRLAARYLLAAGITDIGMILGPNHMRAVAERETGFLDELWATGRVEVGRKWISRGQPTFESGFKAVSDVFAGDQLPRAVFCSNDILGYGAISAIRTLGLRVPEDVWVIGVDGLPMSGWEVFDLTTIRQPVEEMARVGLKLLQARINGDASPFLDVQLDTDLVIRGSTARVPSP